MAQQETMSLMEFMARYGTNEACREHLYQMRWGEGFVCPKCGVKDEPFNIKSRGLYQCRHCNHQASVTAGTIMDRSQDEFVFRFNRRLWQSQLFNRTVSACLASAKFTRYDLIG